MGPLRTVFLVLFIILSPCRFWFGPCTRPKLYVHQRYYTFLLNWPMEKLRISMKSSLRELYFDLCSLNMGKEKVMLLAFSLNKCCSLEHGKKDSFLPLTFFSAYGIFLKFYTYYVKILMINYSARFSHQ